jgi:hypothetical protein
VRKEGRKKVKIHAVCCGHQKEASMKLTHIPKYNHVNVMERLLLLYGIS